MNLKAAQWAAFLFGVFIIVVTRLALPSVEPMKD